MASTTAANTTMGYHSDSEDGQATGGRKLNTVSTLPGASRGQGSQGLNQPAGQLLKGATDEDGKLKDAALMVGIKLDLEAEIHLTARVRGDITIGLY